MLLHAVAERIAADAEKAGSAGLVASGFGQGFREQPAFLLVEGTGFGNHERGAGSGLFVAEEVREVADIDHSAHDHDAGVADDIFEFADVAGPVVLAEEQLGPIGEAVDGLIELGGELGDEVAGEELEVAVALEQAGRFQLNHGEAVEEIFAEGSFGDHGAKIMMSGGDDADVDLARVERAEALNLLILQGAQELGLGREGHVADLVEEQGAVVGVFKQAGLVLRGARESAFHVAEELAFKERFDDGGAVKGHERASGGGAELMQRFGDEFLAGAGGAGDEDGSIVRGDALDLRVQVPHGWAVADHAGEAGLGGERPFEIQSAEAGAMAGEERRQAGAEDVGREGLVEIVGGAFADGFDGGFGGVEGRGENDVDGGIELDDAFQELHAIETGHHEIRQDDLGVVSEDEFEAGFGIGEGVGFDVQIL